MHSISDFPADVDKIIGPESLWFCDPGGCSYKKDDEAGPVVSRWKAKR